MFGQNWDKAEATIATDFWAPSIRDVVSVLVKSKDRKVKFDKHDDRLSVKAYHAAKKKAFEDAQAQPAGSPPAAWATATELPDAVANKLAQLGIVVGAPVAVVQTPEARLVQLKTLQDRGLVSAEEYAEQRQRILDEL